MVAEVGYPKTSFSCIAEHAGISPGLISYHFETKDVLVRAVASEIVDTMETAIRERLADAASYSAALRGIIEGQVDFFATHTDAVATLASIRADAQDAGTGLSLAIARREDAVLRLERFFRGRQVSECPSDARA